MKKLWVLLLSACLGLGTLVAQDFNTLMERAQKGDVEAQFNLGYIYDIGLGVPQDDAQAVKWYRLAADQGNVLAQAAVGATYYNGRGVPQDYAQAVKWFSLAADQGYVSAQYLLGGMYALGRGVPEDYVLAHAWLNLAAAQGFADGTKIRDLVAKRMTPQQIAQAQELARNWKPKK